MLHKNRFELDLETCCIGDLCTLNRNGVPWPIIYGVGVNVKTGDIFPAQFNEKGPDMDLRYARTLTGGDNVGVSIKSTNHKGPSIYYVSIVRGGGPNVMKRDLIWT